MYTENKKKNNAKYDKMHIKRINLSMKKEEAEKIENTALTYNCNLSLFCRKCIRYCIDNNINVNDIDI